MIESRTNRPWLGRMLVLEFSNRELFPGILPAALDENALVRFFIELLPLDIVDVSGIGAGGGHGRRD